MVPAGIVITVFMNVTINRQAISGEQMRSISKEKNRRRGSLSSKRLFPYFTDLSPGESPQTSGDKTARTALRSEDI